MNLTFKRIFCAIIAMTMLVALTACRNEEEVENNSQTTEQKVTETANNTDTEAGSAEEDVYTYVKPDEDVTIDVFSMCTNGSGIQDDPLADYMQNEFGLIINWQPAAGDTGKQKLSAMMAAGDLPDVVGFHTDELEAAADSAEAGLLIDLSTKADMLPNVIKYGEKSMDYFADSLGGGTKYFVGQGISNSILQGDLNWAISLRWDLYKEIGMPEIGTMNDLIPILQQMQALEPETEDGKKVYGMSFWPDWDGAAIFMPSEYMGLYGVEIRPGYTEYYAATGETKNSLADGSMYYQALKFFYDINQAGLLDPDSLSQRYENAKSKYEAGRALMAFHGWVTRSYNSVEGNDEAGKGFVSLYPEDATILVDQSASTGIYPYGISSTSKKEEYALKFLDFYFSTEYCSISCNGLEGETWEMVDGSPVLTELGWELNNSGELAKTYSFYTHPGLDSTYYDEYKGEPISNSYWNSTIEASASNLNNVTKDYYETLGIAQPIDQLDYDKNLIIRQAYGLVPTLDDDTSAILSKITPIVIESSWKMVFAEDEEEFNSIWADMQEKAEDLGLQTVLAAGEEATVAYNVSKEKYGDETIINYNK